MADQQAIYSPRVTQQKLRMRALQWLLKAITS